MYLSEGSACGQDIGALDLTITSPLNSTVLSDQDMNVRAGLAAQQPF